MPPPKLSSHAPDTLHNIVTRGMMAVLGLGALTVVLDPGSVKSYSNEVEYAKARGHELRTGKQHRCNDRLEDFIQVGHAMHHTGGRQACTVALLRGAFNKTACMACDETNKRLLSC